jgi:hypothetical protein
MNTPVQVDRMHSVLFAIESFDQIYEALQKISARITGADPL